MTHRCQRNTTEDKIAKALKFPTCKVNSSPWSELINILLRIKIKAICLDVVFLNVRDLDIVQLIY